MTDGKPELMTLDSASPIRKMAAIAAVCTAEVTVLLDGTTINVALPSMSEHFRASFSLTQWFVDSYILVFASLLLVAGAVGDRVGRKLVLQLGLAVIVGAAVLGASASSPLLVLISRVIMGVGAAAVFPGTLALMTTMFSNRRTRNTAITIWTAMSGVSVAIGPVVGGLLIEHFSWRSVFWINLPLCAVALASVALTVPRTQTKQQHQFDPIGQVTLLVAIVAMVWTIIEAPHRGWISFWTIGGFAIALIVGAIFCRHEQKWAQYPMLDVGTFGKASFYIPAASISVLYLTLFGFLFLVTQYFQAVRGWSPLESGVAVLPVAVAFAAGAALAEVAQRRFGARLIIATGFALVGAGFAVCGCLGTDSSYLRLIGPAMVLVALGGALVQGPATATIMNAVPAHKAGTGSAVNDTTREIGAALGVAIFGSIVNSVYRPRAAAALQTAPIPPAARDFLADSILALPKWMSTQVPASMEPVRQHIADTTRTAFVAGTANAAWTSAAVMVLALVAVLIGLRDSPMET